MTKVPMVTLEDRRLVEREVTFTGALTGEYGEPVWRFGYPCVVPTPLQTKTYFPSKGRNFGNHILVSLCLHCGYFYPLLVNLIILLV